jgi:hypothetical protein
MKEKIVAVFTDVVKDMKRVVLGPRKMNYAIRP